MPDRRFYKPWTELPCEECGRNFHITRTEGREVAHERCGECESYRKGYEEGVQHTLQPDLESVGHPVKGDVLVLTLSPDLPPEAVRHIVEDFNGRLVKRNGPGITVLVLRAGERAELLRPKPEPLAELVEDAVARITKVIDRQAFEEAVRRERADLRVRMRNAGDQRDWDRSFELEAEERRLEDAIQRCGPAKTGSKGKKP